MRRSRTTRHEILGNAALFSFSVTVSDEIYTSVSETSLSPARLDEKCVQRAGEGASFEVLDPPFSISENMQDSVQLLFYSGKQKP